MTNTTAAYDFECTHCGACCRGDWYERDKRTTVIRAWVVIDDDDAERLEKCLGVSEAKFMELYRWDGGGIEVTKSVCPFYDHEKKRCSVHDVKPKVCASYPWADINIKEFIPRCEGIKIMEK